MMLLTACLLPLMFNALAEPSEVAELAIRGVDVFDSEQKRVLPDRTILIRAGLITAVLAEGEAFEAREVLEGRGRLAVPGFVDTHTHLKNVYGTYEQSEAFLSDEVLDLDRSKLSDTYLRYGVTTLVDMGMPERALKPTLEWMGDPDPAYPNLYVCGGALITDRERDPYVNHAEVAGAEGAREKVREYAELGLRHIKLYSWLERTELEAAVAAAQERGLVVSGHIDRREITIPMAMELGVRNFEHLLSLPSSVLNYDDHWDRMYAAFELEPMESVDEWVAAITFLFPYMRADPALNRGLEALLDGMAAEGATLSTTVHQMAAVTGRADFFSSFGGDDDQAEPNLPNYDEARMERLGEAYDVMLSVLKAAHDKGVVLRIGTDCRRGGEAFLSELRLLHEAGFAMEDVLQIATWNGARAMGLGDRCGSLAPGKAADIVLFERSPLEDPAHIYADRTILKDGVLFGGH